MCANTRVYWKSRAKCASELPPALIEQLKPGGKMVIPVGAPGRYQELMLISKSADGKTESRRVLAVRFVPLTGGTGAAQ